MTKNPAQAGQQPEHQEHLEDPKKASARQEHDQHLGHGRLVPSKMLCLDLHGISTPI